MSHVPSRAILRLGEREGMGEDTNQKGEAILLLRPVDVQEIPRRRIHTIHPSRLTHLRARRSDRHDTRGRIETKIQPPPSLCRSNIQPNRGHWTRSTSGEGVKIIYSR